MYTYTIHINFYISLEWNPLRYHHLKIGTPVRSDAVTQQKKNGKSHLDDHNLDPKLSQNLHGIAKLQYEACSLSFVHSFRGSWVSRQLWAKHRQKPSALENAQKVYTRMFHLWKRYWNMETLQGMQRCSISMMGTSITAPLLAHPGKVPIQHQAGGNTFLPGSSRHLRSMQSLASTAHTQSLPGHAMHWHLLFPLVSQDLSDIPDISGYTPPLQLNAQ